MPVNKKTVSANQDNNRSRITTALFAVLVGAAVLAIGYVFYLSINNSDNPKGISLPIELIFAVALLAFGTICLSVRPNNAVFRAFLGLLTAASAGKTLLSSYKMPEGLILCVTTFLSLLSLLTLCAITIIHDYRDNNKTSEEIDRNRQQHAKISISNTTNPKSVSPKTKKGKWTSIFSLLFSFPSFYIVTSSCIYAANEGNTNSVGTYFVLCGIGIGMPTLLVSIILIAKSIRTRYGAISLIATALIALTFIGLFLFLHVII